MPCILATVSISKILGILHPVLKLDVIFCRGVIHQLNTFTLWAVHTKEHVLCCSHRMLAKRAAELGGQPWLVSFSGMADVLGWPKRPPLVAEEDRGDVLASWAEQCGGLVPCQRFIPFAEVRSLSPEDFVRVLAEGVMVSASAHASSGITTLKAYIVHLDLPCILLS